MKKFFLLMVSVLLLCGVTMSEASVPMTDWDANPPPATIQRPPMTNRSPFNGYFSFTVPGTTRTAKIYFGNQAILRPFIYVIAVPSGVNTGDFLVNSGWVKFADEVQEVLVALEPVQPKPISATSIGGAWCPATRKS